MGNACHNGGLGGQSPGETQTEAHDDHHAPVALPVEHALSKKASLEPFCDKSPAEAESNATTSTSVEEVATAKQGLLPVASEPPPANHDGISIEEECSEQPLLDNMAEETSSLPAGPETSEEPSASACSSLTQKDSVESSEKPHKKAAKAAKGAGEGDSTSEATGKDGKPAAKARSKSHSPRTTKPRTRPKAGADSKNAEPKNADSKKELAPPSGAVKRAPSHDTATSNIAKKEDAAAAAAAPKLKRVNSDPLKDNQKTSPTSFAEPSSGMSSPRLGNRGQSPRGGVPATAALPKRGQVGDASPGSPSKKKAGDQTFHILKVSILSARGLRNADDNFGGTSDPFCVCDIPGKPKSRFQTKVVWQQTEPIWNLEVEMSGVSPTDCLRFNVYDKDTFSSKDLLGKVELPHHKFIHNGFSGEVRLLETSGGTAMSVESYLNLQISPIRTFFGDPKTTKCTVKKLSEGGYIKTGDKDAPKLIVTLVGARGLRNADWAVNGLSDPYCVCEVPGKPFSRILTPVVQDRLDPEWNYTREICDWEPGDSLSFAVFDKDYGKKDDLLGRATLAAERIYPFAFDGEIPLFDQGKQRQGTLIVKVVSDSTGKDQE